MQTESCLPLSAPQAAPTTSASRERVETARDAASDALRRHALGDPRAFEQLYSELAPRLRRLCVSLIGRTEAEELLQEVFLKLHSARARFDPGGSAIAWSFAIARTSCIDRMRRKRRRPEAAIDQQELEALADPNACGPEQSFAHTSLEHALEAELLALSDTLRGAFVLVKLEGLSCQEASLALGASLSATKQRVHRAAEELKEALREAGFTTD